MKYAGLSLFLMVLFLSPVRAVGDESVKLSSPPLPAKALEGPGTRKLDPGQDGQ